MTEAAVSAAEPPARSVLRIGAIDDHPMLLAGLAAGLAATLPEAVVAPVCTSLAEFLAADPDVDLVLLDLELRDGSAPDDNVAALRRRGWPVLMFTQDRRRPLIAAALRAGAAGVVSKGESLAVVAEAVRAVHAGEAWYSREWADALLWDTAAHPHLGDRELETVRMYAAGRPLKTVARSLGISPETAKTHLRRVRTKYADVGRAAGTKSELYQRLVEDGRLPDQPDSSP